MLPFSLGRMERLDCEGAVCLIDSYGGKSLHKQSYGESFISLVINRFGGQGLYILDEPEAALSPSRQMTLLSQLHQLVEKGSQFIIATHSPILMAYPNAGIFTLDDAGMTITAYEETEHYQLTKNFLNHPEQMLHYLFAAGVKGRFACFLEQYLLTQVFGHGRKKTNVKSFEFENKW